MKTKFIISAAFCLGTVLAQAQTMRWIPSPATGQFGKCTDQSSKSGLTQCYALEYTPAVSGTLTSYTTGFLVSCTSLGSAIAKNQSCSMTPKNNEVNGCSSIGKTLLNSSGNSGTITNNQIEAGVPVILHQVCLTIPTGEAVSIEEEPVTDLTTSVDLGNGGYVTEFPVFETVTFRRFKYDDATQTAFLDFRATRAGDLKSKLDWSVPGGAIPVKYLIERSEDGHSFSPVGELNGIAEDIRISSYQFLDEDAMQGINYYRIRQADPSGKEIYSPVREVYFGKEQFAVNATPNPAKDKLYVQIAHPGDPGKVTLYDVSGKERLIALFEVNQSNLVLDLEALEQGTYTLQVTSGKETHVEKIVVIR